MTCVTQPADNNQTRETIVLFRILYIRIDHSILVSLTLFIFAESHALKIFYKIYLKQIQSIHNTHNSLIVCLKMINWFSYPISSMFNGKWCNFGLSFVWGKKNIRAISCVEWKLKREWINEKTWSPKWVLNEIENAIFIRHCKEFLIQILCYYCFRAPVTNKYNYKIIDKPKGCNLFNSNVIFFVSEHKVSHQNKIWVEFVSAFHSIQNKITIPPNLLAENTNLKILCTHSTCRGRWHHRPWEPTSLRFHGHAVCSESPVANRRCHRLYVNV